MVLCFLQMCPGLSRRFALSWPVVILLIDLYDMYSPILEEDSMQWVVMASALSLLLCLVMIIWSWIRKPSAADLAIEVEKANPQLHDLLNCAVELQKKSKSQNLTFMENRVLQTTEGQVRSIVWGKGTRPSSLYWVSVLLGLGVGTGLAVWGTGQSPVRKAIDSLSDEPGLTVSTSLTGTLTQEEGPPNNEFTRGSDVSIFADIIRGHRGQKEAKIEYLLGEETESIDMLETSVIGRFEYVVPAIRETFEYRVVTPSLVTEWHRVIPYDPPALKSALWKIIPPAYLKMESFEHDGFGYVRVPEGSEISLNLEVEPLPERVDAKLISMDGNLSLESNQTRFTHTFCSRSGMERSSRTV